MVRIGSLFTGYSGLDMAVEAVLGGRTVWHAEIDPAACRVLQHRYPGVPNVGDVTTVDWGSVEPVDVVTAGYPCQPFSAAGRRLGEQDDRYLWPEVERAVRDLGPRLVVLENVAGHLVRGFPAVLGSLAEIGYDARWACVRASDVGAPHRRERLFAVAWPAADAAHVGHERSRRARDGGPGPADGRRSASDAPGEQVGAGGLARARAGRAAPHAEGDGRHERRAEPAGIKRGSDAAERGATPADAVRQQPVPVAGGGGAAVAELAGTAAADATGERRAGRDQPQPHMVGDGQEPAHAGQEWGAYAPAVNRWQHVLGRAAPAPTEPGRNGNARLSPRFVEWLMGLPEGWVTGVPGVSRNDALRLLGNGVVPQQAAAALEWLLSVEEAAA